MVPLNVRQREFISYIWRIPKFQSFVFKGKRDSGFQSHLTNPMEIPGFASSFPEGNHNDPQCSQWLEMALSEFNEKTRAMMTILEDGNFLAGAEIYDQRRLDFVQMLQDLNRFCSSLTKEHDRMRMQTHQTMNTGSTSSSSRTNSYKTGLEEGSDAESYNNEFDSENLDKLANKLIPGKPSKMTSQISQEIWENHMELQEEGFFRKDNANMISMNDLLQKTAGDSLEQTYEMANSWSDLKIQVTKLMEDNLQQQVELARRNVEKKVVINRLRLQLEHLKAENRALRDCISCLNGRDKPSQVHITKIRGPVLGKYFGGCS